MLAINERRGVRRRVMEQIVIAGIGGVPYRLASACLPWVALSCAIALTQVLVFLNAEHLVIFAPRLWAIYSLSLGYQ